VAHLRRALVWDQGDLGRCTGMTLARALMTDGLHQGSWNFGPKDPIAVYRIHPRRPGPRVYPPGDTGLSSRRSPTPAMRPDAPRSTAFTCSRVGPLVRCGPAASAACPHPVPQAREAPRDGVRARRPRRSAPHPPPLSSCPPLPPRLPARGRGGRGLMASRSSSARRRLSASSRANPAPSCARANSRPRPACARRRGPGPGAPPTRPAGAPVRPGPAARRRR
jgi:hypothetical protein